MKRNLLWVLIVSAFVLNSVAWGQTAVKITPAEKQIVEGVTADQLRNYLYFVASDEMEGRDTPSRGLDTTAKFIGMNLQRWGFKPAGDDGTFYQHIELLRYKINPANTNVSIGSQALAWGTDYLATANAGSVANAPLVFGGNGWFVKSKNLAPLTGVDVKGKVVVVYAEQSPKGMNFRQLGATGKQGVDWMDPVAYAKQNRGVGIIFVATPATVNSWDRTRRARETGGGYFVEKLRNVQPDGFPSIALSQKQSENLFSGESATLDAIVKAYGADQPLPSVTFGGKAATINV